MASTSRDRGGKCTLACRFEELKWIFQAPSISLSSEKFAKMVCMCATSRLEKPRCAPLPLIRVICGSWFSITKALVDFIKSPSLCYSCTQCAGGMCCNHFCYNARYLSSRKCRTSQASLLCLCGRESKLVFHCGVFQFGLAPR